MAMKKYKDTLILPKTNFPIKSSPASEETRINEWYCENLFDKRICMHNALRPVKFVLHDGPPYANGHLHHGHILNKVLKDIVIKSKFMAGCGVEFVPGWDTHGLPIEVEVDKKLGHKKHELSKLEFRKLCREYAAEYVDIQRKEFERLGVLGSWDDSYMTMTNHYEAQTVRELANFARAGLLYKGIKPVYWCPTHRTALAEAEIDYKEDHVSTSVYALLKVKDKPSRYLVIWTTTPWTLEANVAVAVSADAQYIIHDMGGAQFIFAKQLANNVMVAVNMVFNDKDTVLTCKGSDLQGMQYELPFGNGTGVVVVSDHVNMESGTGCVHIAPAHGEDDFIVGKKYGLPIVSAIGDDGKTKAGLNIEASNKYVIDSLTERKMLLYTQDVTHKYPYSARSHRPVIVKTADQWFISVDKPFNGGPSLRDRALAAIKEVKWIPGYGYNRIKGMLETRPDWCLSRQRTWGVPIPVFYDSNGPVIDPEVMDTVADVYEREGADAWYEMDSDQLSHGKLPAGLRKEMDILDVWFDSGVSNAAVMGGKQVDLYLEGSDQHRGWFQSTLLAALGSRELVPYKAVLTHGFVVDEHGEKLAKSKKNYVDPFAIIKQEGAEVLRLWVASSAFTEDIRVSKTILDGVKQTYHKIRNTTRYLLATLSDFEPYTNMVRPEDLKGLDKYMVLLAQQLEGRVKKAYEDYDYCAVVKDVEHFCNIDLSSFYFDVVKDILYCDRENSNRRRSVQTAMYRIARILIHVMSPILCFSMDEAWGYLPKLNKDMDRVHLPSYDLPYLSVDDFYDNLLVDKYNMLRTLRRAVNIKLEEIRNNKEIGAPYEAEVGITAPAEYWQCTKNMEEVRQILMVSKVTIVTGETLTVEARHASGPQCQRCWSFVGDVGTHEPNDVCERCAEALRHVNGQKDSKD